MSAKKKKRRKKHYHAVESITDKILTSKRLYTIDKRAILMIFFFCGVFKLAVGG